MEIVNGEFPPNIDKIREKFEIHDKVVFTFGNRLYVPCSLPVDDALLAHEETHAKQQGDDPASWWDKYLIDAHFRVGQELAAYRRQYKVFKRKIGAPDVRKQYLTHLATALSSKIYGEAISFHTAYKKIRQAN